MIKKGQIVEIPSTSAIYAGDKQVYPSKRDELTGKLQKRNYNLFDGFLVGEHPGIEHFKLGQRKGINVGGKNAPLYVIGINENNNQLFVGEGDQHPGLWTDVIRINKDQTNYQDLDLTDELLTEGVDVSIHFSLIENEVSAKFYAFDNAFFLEFERLFSITIQDHPLEIRFNNNNTKTIKLIK